MARDLKWIRFFTFLLIFFNLYFPKGGFKISNVPITWGVLLFCIIGIFSLLKKCFFPIFVIEKNRIIVLAALLPFELFCIICFYENGIENMGFFLSFLFNFYFVPWIMLLGFGRAFDELDSKFLFQLIKTGIRFVSIYGIFLFFFKMYYGEFIEIPYLTVNYDDIGMLGEKHINRGDGFFKLISTYNNGNIYGVCMLMFLPLFLLLEKNVIWRWMMRISLLLTLSRTVWIGVVLYEFIEIMFSKFTWKKSIAFSLITISLIGSVFYISESMGRDINFIFDSTLGGRIDQLENEKTFIPSKEFTDIGEITYMGIANNFGIIGLFLFLVLLITPIVLYLKRKNRNAIYKSAIEGYIIYIIVAGSDGGLLFIPVLIFFWFLILILTSPRYNQ